MKRIVLIFIAIVFLSSCSSDNNNISGTITNLPEGTPLFLDYLTPSDVTTIDTAFIAKNGQYNFNKNIAKSGYYRLKIDNQRFLNLVFEADESPVINGDANDLIETYAIEGSEESIRLKAFQSAYSQNDYTTDSLQKVFQVNPNLIAELKQSQAASVNRMNTAFISLINAKLGSLVSLAAVQQLDQKKYADFYKRVDQALTKKIADNPWVIDFHQKVVNMDNLSIGKPAPDFTLNNPEGNAIALSSLKGKVVLIDFWASWCRPCRMENPNVVKAYKKFNPQGFEVFSVSLDGVPQQQNAKQDWINAIKADGLVWKNHASSLEGWNSSVIKTYGIKGIPFTILIDKEGIIIGKNLKGKALEHQLASIFK